VPGGQVHAWGGATPALVTGPSPQDALVETVPHGLGSGDQTVLAGDQGEEVRLRSHDEQNAPKQALSVVVPRNPPP